MSQIIAAAWRPAVLAKIDAERNRQDTKFGDRASHPVGTWLTILGEEYGELCQASLRDAGQSPTYRPIGELTRQEATPMLAEVLQVAAVAVAIAELLEMKVNGVSEPVRDSDPGRMVPFTTLCDLCDQPDREIHVVFHTGASYCEDCYLTRVWPVLREIAQKS